jgi:hypothetical protein
LEDDAISQKEQFWSRKKRRENFSVLTNYGTIFLFRIPMIIVETVNILIKAMNINTSDEGHNNQGQISRGHGKREKIISSPLSLLL